MACGSSPFFKDTCSVRKGICKPNAYIFPQGYTVRNYIVCGGDSKNLFKYPEANLIINVKP